MPLESSDIIVVGKVDPSVDNMYGGSEQSNEAFEFDKGRRVGRICSSSR